MSKSLCIVLLIMLCVSVVGCGQVRGELSLSTYVLPLTISVDTAGQISFRVSPGIDIPTPIGTLSAGLVLDATEHFELPAVLTVRLNGTDFFYDLHGEDFVLRVESAYYEVIRFSKQGGNLWVELQTSATPGSSAITIPLYHQKRLDVLFSENFATLTVEKIVVRASEFDVHVESRTYIYDGKGGAEIPVEISCLSEFYAPTTTVLGIKLPSGASSSTTYGLLREQTLENTSKLYRGIATFSRDILREGGIYTFCLGCMEELCSDELPLP